MTPDRGILTRAAALVELGLGICDRYGLNDLASGLVENRRALAAPAVHIVVVGDFKRGKSSLVNALVGADVCPVDDATATTTPTYVRHGSAPSAALILEGAEARHEPIETDDIARYALEGGVGAQSAAGAQAAAGQRTATEHADPGRIAGIEIKFPSDLLAGGLVIVDTPGAGGLGSTHAGATLAALSMADAVLFVIDAEQELTRTELEFLGHARSLCDTVACVLTKTDFFPAWRKVRTRDEQLLDGVPLLPVSSTLRLRAVETGDAALDVESGFPELVDLLRDNVEATAHRRLAADAAVEVVAVCDHIAGQFEAEVAALSEPTAAPRRSDRRSHADQPAGWRRSLDDGIAGIGADLEHDLRARIEQIITEADTAIDGGDPADTWAQMASWLQTRISGELIENYTLLVARADRLSDETAERFRAEATTRPGADTPAAVGNETTALSDISTGNRATAGRMPAMAALKDTYGGALPFALLGGVADVTLDPITVGITLVMGQTGLRDEKERLRYDRRSQARSAVRRYCAEVIALMDAGSRDTLHRIQRGLARRCTVRTDQITRSISYAQSAVMHAARRTEAQRASRLADLEAELARVRELRDRAVSS